MLNQIPVNTNNTMRAVVLRHPNSVEVSCFRKQIKRVDTPAGSMGGLPTLGGLGVLDSEDEDDFDYTPLGDGKLLPCEPFQPSSLVDRGDRGDSIDAAEGVLTYCMVEPVAKPDAPEHFELKTHDLVFLIVWQGVYVGYEVVGRETNINIAPFTRRYALNKRDDLKFLGAMLPP